MAVSLTLTLLHRAGHKNWVLCVAWSQDCEFIASGSMDNDVRIWDPMSGHCLKTLKGHTKYVIGLAWEPMHKYVANLLPVNTSTRTSMSTSTRAGTDVV